MISATCQIAPLRADGPATPLMLAPARNGYRRNLYRGRGVCVYYDRHPPNEWGEHFHQHVQLSVLLDGVECHVRWKSQDGEWREARPRGPTVWVLPAATRHMLTWPSEGDMVTLFLEPTFVHEIIETDVTEFTMIDLPHLACRDVLIAQLSKAFQRLCGGQEPANTLYVESIGTVLAAHVLQALLGGEGPRHLHGGLSDEALQRVMRFIDEHLADPLDLTTLSREARFGPSHFGRLFRQSLGLPPHEYVMRRRVAGGVELLEQTDKKEVEIAELCGFSDDTHMARWFRRVLDCRPSDIRIQREK